MGAADCVVAFFDEGGTGGAEGAEFVVAAAGDWGGWGGVRKRRVFEHVILFSTVLQRTCDVLLLLLLPLEQSRIEIDASSKCPGLSDQAVPTAFR